jgi:hypothetical protein
MQVDEKVTDDDLTWIKQMGVQYLDVQTGKGRGTYRAVKRGLARRQAEPLPLLGIDEKTFQKRTNRLRMSTIWNVAESFTSTRTGPKTALTASGRR